MTNIVQFPAQEPDLADVTRKFMQDTVDAARDLVLRHQALEKTYVVGTNPWDFRDDNRYALNTLRNEARGFIAKWSKLGEGLGIPDQIIEMVVPQAAPIMANLDKAITIQLDAPRPATATYTPPRRKAEYRNAAFAEHDARHERSLQASHAAQYSWSSMWMVWVIIAGIAGVILVIANTDRSTVTTTASTYSSSPSSSPSVWPYFWAGIHNGRVSHGFGVRGSGRRHH